jgi:hypothetical protein
MLTHVRCWTIATRNGTQPGAAVVVCQALVTLGETVRAIARCTRKLTTMTHVTVDGTQPTPKQVDDTHTDPQPLISLDGFATGDGQRADAPWGTPAHGCTSGCSPRFGAPKRGRWRGQRGHRRCNHPQHEPGIGAEIMGGAGKSGPPGWEDDANWKGRSRAVAEREEPSATEDLLQAR